MAAGVPPPPLNSPSGSYYWLEWYTNLTNFLNGTNIPWSNLNFTGSNLTDLQTRLHNSLQGVQGGNTAALPGKAYHLLGAEFIGQVASAGTAIVLPPTWTVSATGATYTVTHNLALATTAYVVMASVQGGASVAQITQTSNSFAVQLTAAGNWNFVLCQGS